MTQRKANEYFQRAKSVTSAYKIGTNLVIISYSQHNIMTEDSSQIKKKRNQKTVREMFLSASFFSWWTAANRNL